MQKIIPNIWFNTEAEEASQFYTSIFRDGKITKTVRYPDAGSEAHGMEAGSVMTTEVEVEGYRLVLLNGGPHFTPNPSISFFVDRASKEEVDELWQKLVEGGFALMPLQSYDFSPYYGWVADKFGVSWQIMLHEGGSEVPPLMPSFLFTGEKAQANDAIDFYTSVFKNAKRLNTHTFEEMGTSDRPGHVAYADFEIEGQRFAAMDGGPDHAFSFNEGISLIITCSNQDEIDYYWEKLSAVPEAEQCGWLKDTFGVSWQVVPEGMEELLNSPDKEKAKEGMEAMLQMKKIIIADLKQ